MKCPNCDTEFKEEYIQPALREVEDEDGGDVVEVELLCVPCDQVFWSWLRVTDFIEAP